MNKTEIMQKRTGKAIWPFVAGAVGGIVSGCTVGGIGPNFLGRATPIQFAGLGEGNAAPPGVEALCLPECRVGSHVVPERASGRCRGSVPGGSADPYGRPESQVKQRGERVQKQRPA